MAGSTYCYVSQSGSVTGTRPDKVRMTILKLLTSPIQTNPDLSFGMAKIETGAILAKFSALVHSGGSFKSTDRPRHEPQ